MRLIGFLFAVTLLFSMGCVQYHYSPNLVQTPYISKKGDGVLSAAIGGGPNTLNGDFHASYSPIKHGTVMLNYFHNRSSFADPNFFGGTTYLQTAKGYLAEAAVGGYIPVAFGTGALYTGFGQGSMRNDYGIQRIADLGIQRFFIQPTFTFQNDWFRLGMGMRLVRLSFPTGDIDYRIEPSDIDVIRRLETDSPFWIPELGGNIGVHLKPVTFSASLVLVAYGNSSDLGYDSSNLGLSISLELQDLFKKTAKTEETKNKKHKAKSKH